VDSEAVFSKVIAQGAMLQLGEWGSHVDGAFSSSWTADVSLCAL
jgi:hypothetical protein